MTSTETMSETPRWARVRRLVVIVAFASSVAACGSGSDASDDSSSDDAASAAPEEGDESSEAPAEPAGDGGSSTGTLTMEDGTSYALQMSSCDTSDNDESFLVDDGYDLTGRTSDEAFLASFNRAGFDEESIVEIVALEGDFDAEGKNSKMIYTDVDGTIALTVDGGNVTGTVTLKAIGPTRPHGDEAAATVDISC